MSPDIIYTAAAVLFGPFVGSFIGLLSKRMPAGRPVAVARSACEGCGRTLAPLDLVPVVSFAAFRGRCRRCGSTIPRRYLALELACAALALWSGLVHDGPLAFLGALLAWQLLLLALLDAEHFWLPRVLTVPLIVTGLAVAAARGGAGGLLEHGLGAAAGFLSLWAVSAAYRRLRGREGLGGGDAWLLAGGGAWVGWPGLPTIVLWGAGAGLAAVAAAWLAGRRIDGDQPIPFGVFLSLGIWLTWLYGPLARGGL